MNLTAFYTIVEIKTWIYIVLKQWGCNSDLQVLF